MEKIVPRGIETPIRDMKQIYSVRIESGVPGFDEMVNGGIVKGNVILLSGPAGSGKTNFAVQFIYKGLQCEDNGVYVTFEESPEQLRRNMSSFNWDLRKFEESNRLIMLDVTCARVGIMGTSEKYYVKRPYTVESILVEIYNSIKGINASRVVIDSIDAMELRSENVDYFRTYLLKLCTMLKSIGCTSLLISGSLGEGRISRYGIEEFVADGIILMKNRSVKVNKNTTDRSKYKYTRVRGIEMRKMRGTRISPDTHEYDITDKGIVIYP